MTTSTTQTQPTEPPQSTQSTQTAASGPAPAAAPAPTTSVWTRFWRHPAPRWLLVLIVVIAIVIGVIAAFTRALGDSGPNDPRSSRPDGASAVAAVLGQEGVQVRPTRSLTEAVQAGAGATVVVAFPERLSSSDANRLLEVPDARIILLDPATAPTAFGAAVTPGDVSFEPVAPSCADPTAVRAGPIELGGDASWRPVEPSSGSVRMACYPVDGGFGYLRLTTAGGRELEILSSGWTNADAAKEGNAALVTGLFGARSTLIWFIAPTRAEGAGDSDAPPRTTPELLPDWWPMATLQLVVGVIVVAIWRGRRLGPILLERLPVSVRASETIEGHGRLLDRLNARDRAAAALRSATIERLGRRYGHAGDLLTLSAALADRTGRDSRTIYQLLAGPEPTDDDQLTTLAEELRRLEHDARQL